MGRKEIGDAAALAAPQLVATLAPVPPVLAEEEFLVLVVRPVVDVLICNRQPERPLVVAQAPGLTNELPRLAERAEPLVIELVGQAAGGNRLQ